MPRAVTLLLAIVLSVMTSCTTEQEGTFAEGNIRNIEITDDSNILRKNIIVSLEEPDGIIVEYGRTDEPEKRRKIISEDEAAVHQLKIIILEEESEYSVDIRTIHEPGKSRSASFRTGKLPDSFVKTENLLPEEYSMAFEGFVHIADKADGGLYLINDKGKTVWYEPTDGKPVISSDYDSRTQTFQAIVGFSGEDSFTVEYIFITDLFGNVIMKQPCSGLSNPDVHHDIKMLPDGNIMVINQVKDEFDLSEAGGGEHDTVTGDGITFMTTEGKPLWEWSAFSELNPEDDPDIMKEDPEFQYIGKDDWLHANSLARDPEGNLYISFNKLSQVWKLSPDGRLKYRIGKDGDIDVASPDCLSDRQHGISVTAEGYLMMFDNGYAAKRSRVLMYDIDEESMTARTVLNLPLAEEDYSPNQSSAYLMPDGNIIYCSTVSRNIGITDRFGNVKWKLHLTKPTFKALYIEKI